MEDLSIWSPVDIEVGRCGCWQMGKRSIWAERYEQEWHVLALPGEEEGPRFSMHERAEKPDSPDWKHYLLTEGGRVIPSPVMMDRPLVVRPDRSLILLPGEKTHFFLSLPLWFRLRVGVKTIADIPLVPLANSWFGDPVAGELCYFTAARLFLEYGKMPLSPFLAACPLWISNESDRELAFDRICLHTEFLGVYRGATRLWTNEVSVVFRGTEQDTQIQASRSAPAFEGAAPGGAAPGGAELMSEPRQAAETWYRKRTFSLLKYFSSF